MDAKKLKMNIYGVERSPLAQAVKEGAEKIGYAVYMKAQSAYRPNNYEKCDLGVCFGLHGPGLLMQQEFADHRTPLFIIDYGYVKRGTMMYSNIDEGKYYSLSLNGLNGRSGQLPAPMSLDRWNSFNVPLEPWKTDGKYILVCGQKLNDVAIGNLNPVLWAKQVIMQLQKITNRPIMFRPHPEDPTQRRPIGIPHSEHATLKEALQDAYAVVAYNSNSLVEAVVGGVPAFVVGTGSMVEAVAHRGIGQIDTPTFFDREQWAADLAWRQYTIQEMRDGLLWKYAFERDIPTKTSQQKIESPIVIKDEHEAIQRIEAGPLSISEIQCAEEVQRTLEEINCPPIELDDVERPPLTPPAQASVARRGRPTKKNS